MDKILRAKIADIVANCDSDTQGHVAIRSAITAKITEFITTGKIEAAQELSAALTDIDSQFLSRKKQTLNTIKELKDG